MRSQIAAGAFFIACVMAPSVFAEAWPRGKGNVYVYLGLATSSSDEFRMPSGDKVPFPGRDNREDRASLYGEIGISDTLTIVLDVPYKSVRTRGLVSTFETDGLADLDVRLRWSTGLRGLWLGAEGGVIVPLGYDAKDFPPLGSGKTAGIVNLALGTSLTFLPEGFLSIDAGYRMRGGDFHDEIPYAAKLGAFPVSRVGVFAFVRGWSSLVDFSRVEPSLGLFVSDSEKTGAGLELYFRLSNRFEANVVWTTTLRGRNITDGDEYAVGVAWRMD